MCKHFSKQTQTGLRLKYVRKIRCLLLQQQTKKQVFLSCGVSFVHCLGCKLCVLLLSTFEKSNTITVVVNSNVCLQPKMYDKKTENNNKNNKYWKNKMNKKNYDNNKCVVKFNLCFFLYVLCPKNNRRWQSHVVVIVLIHNKISASSLTYAHTQPHILHIFVLI